MRKFSLLLLAVCFLLAFTSCYTGYFLNEETTEGTPFGGVETTEDYSVSVSALYGNNMIASHVVLSVVNNGSTPIIIDLNKSAYVGINSSQRMVDGSTIVMNSNLSQPLYTVAPNSTMTRDLYDPQQIGFYGNPSGNDSLNPRVTLCLTIDGKDHFCDIVLQKPTSSKEIIGTIEFSTIKLYPLFIGSTTNAILNSAQKEAEKQYGKGVSVENINYEVNWNPLSLLLYFDAFGYVKNISGTADVVR